jgi:diguanylate cyclase (GGDEF)-like protein
MENKMSDCAVFSKAKPADEYGRQRALERLEILDTPSEKPFEEITKLVSMTLNVPICAVSLIDDDRQWFKSSQGLGVDQTCRSMAFCDHAIRADAPFIIEDATSDPRFSNNPLVTGEPHIRAYAGVPLRMPDGYLIGTLCMIDQKARVFSQAEIDVLANFARLVVGEIELRKTASVDPLTKLASRQAWHKATAREIAQADRDGSPAALLLLDVDHFKLVNDTYGHAAGDAVLRSIASAIRQMLRQSDIVGRVGGEEFAVTLPHTDAEKASKIAEKIRATVERLHFDEVADLACSISIGGAVYSSQMTVADWMAVADKRLYKAKREGRNRVEIGHSSALREQQEAA